MSHLQTSELVCGEVLFNSLLLDKHISRLPVHYVLSEVFANAAMLIGNIGDQQRSSFLIMCECSVHIQYSRKYYQCERWKKKKKKGKRKGVSYIKVTVCYKVQMDVQQSVPGVQCSVPKW